LRAFLLHALHFFSVMFFFSQGKVTLRGKIDNYNAETTLKSNIFTSIIKKRQSNWMVKGYVFYIVIYQHWQSVIWIYDLSRDPLHDVLDQFLERWFWLLITLFVCSRQSSTACRSRPGCKGSGSTCSGGLSFSKGLNLSCF
jgi:hypothetical protein